MGDTLQPPRPPLPDDELLHANAHPVPEPVTSLLLLVALLLASQRVWTRVARKDRLR